MKTKYKYIYTLLGGVITVVAFLVVAFTMSPAWAQDTITYLPFLSISESELAESAASVQPPLADRGVPTLVPIGGTVRPTDEPNLVDRWGNSKPPDSLIIDKPNPELALPSLDEVPTAEELEELMRYEPPPIKWGGAIRVGNNLINLPGNVRIVAEVYTVHCHGSPGCSAEPYTILATEKGSEVVVTKISGKIRPMYKFVLDDGTILKARDIPMVDVAEFRQLLEKEFAFLMSDKYQLEIDQQSIDFGNQNLLERRNNED